MVTLTGIGSRMRSHEVVGGATLVKWNGTMPTHA